MKWKKWNNKLIPFVCHTHCQAQLICAMSTDPSFGAVKKYKGAHSEPSHTHSNIIISMGAIHKQTGAYVRAANAVKSKTNGYMCPECEKVVIPRQGKILRHHFAHKKSNAPCTYYNHPSESQIHKDAKMLLKNVLENGAAILVVRWCNTCAVASIINITINARSRIVLEHGFRYNDKQKYADVACLDDDKLCYVFEICHTHATCEGERPEPWFEIDAMSFIEHVNNVSNTSNQFDTFQVVCTRNMQCQSCRDSKAADTQRQQEAQQKQEEDRQRQETRCNQERTRRKQQSEEHLGRAQTFAREQNKINELYYERIGLGEKYKKCQLNNINVSPCKSVRSLNSPELCITCGEQSKITILPQRTQLCSDCYNIHLNLTFACK